MQYISHLYLPGAVPVWAALVFAVAAVYGWSLVLRGDDSARPFARRAYGFFALSVVLVAVVMLLALWRRDFRIEYVYQYSGLDLPGHYQLAALWAGQKGSFLIWLLWGSLIGLGVMRTAGRAEASVMSIYTLTLIGLLFILVRENPFVMLGQTPLDGKGLNPLLQDDWMVIHPPIMFIGYALSAVPFSFAMAALWRRDYDDWAARAFPWALTGFLVLGCAILMGGYWAYKTLGWGGYWGWDPVENASLIPWLFGTVLIHGLYLERTKKRYRRANYLLASLVYLAVLYGTFLTRSGVLADFSVHSFVDLGISGWLIALMVVFLTLPLVLMTLRLREVPTERNEDPLLSRGAFLVMSTLTVLASALVITAGTSAPLLTRFLTNPGQVGPSFYNQVNLPIALLVAFLLSIVPFLTWRGEPLRAVLGKLAIPAAVGLAVALTAWFAFAVRDPLHLALLLLATTALLTNLQKTFRRAAANGLGAAGGWLAHVGVGIMLIGFLASSAYDHSTKVTLAQGQPQAVDGMNLTFTRPVPRQGNEKERMEVKVERADGSVYYAYPKLFLNDRTRQVMAHPHVHSLALQDIYISPMELDPGRQPGQPERVQLAQGESVELDGTTVRFTGFEIQGEGGPTASMMALRNGGSVTVGAALEVSPAGAAPPAAGEAVETAVSQTSATGSPAVTVQPAVATTAVQRIEPLYTFSADGRVNAPPVQLPGGGMVMVSGINANDGKVQLDLVGLPSAGPGEPARLSLDVTRKPLIQLVWYGLYVVLFGGLLSTWKRLRQSRQLDSLQPATD